MTEAKHTRAPWRISDENPKIIKQDFSMIGSNHGAIVACACGYDNTVLYPSDEQAIANARPLRRDLAGSHEAASS